MSYQVMHLPIVEMHFSGQVSIAEFQQWLADVEVFLRNNKISSWSCKPL